MIQRNWVERWLRVVALGAVLALGCDDSPSSSAHVSNAAGESGAPAPNSSGGDGPTDPQARDYIMLLDSFSPAATALGAGGNGEGGAGPQLPLGPPYGTSTNCGDGIVGSDEECDDGQSGVASEVDACTDECETRDQPGGPVPPPDESADRYLGAGRHPVAALEDRGFVTTYVNVGGEEPAIGATLFNIWGQTERYVTVSEGASPIYEANPVAAALPSGGYAIAWGDFDGDGSDLGVALRRLTTEGELGARRSANEITEFSQLNPDMIWTGTELVVAWEDYSDAFNGPDLRVRTFDASLNPMSSDVTLAGSGLPEAAVALTPFNGGWAAAYREGASDGSETIVVKVGDASFRVGPVNGGPLDDRPALVELDHEHLLLVFSAGTLSGASEVYNTPRLRYAIIDIGAIEPPTSQALEPLDDVFSHDAAQSHASPALAPAEGGAYLSWRSEARPGDAAGDQVWLKFVRWREAATELELGEVEVLSPRLCEGSAGDQRRPALATVGLPPAGALAIAWEDFAKRQGEGEPDVVVHYAPTHARSPGAEALRVFKEGWEKQADGAAWRSHWTNELTGSFGVTAQRGAGRVVSTGGTLALAHVNHETALNVDVVSEIRLSMSSRAGLFARRADADPDSYLSLSFGSRRDEPWRIRATIDGVVTDLQTVPPTGNVPVRGLEYAYRARLRVETQPSGDLLVAARIWPSGGSEPTAWLLQHALPSTSPIATRFATAGRFGVLAHPTNVGSRRATFDDFVATFYEGNVVGVLDALPVDHPLPLKRGVASYRPCQDGSPCDAGQGCCISDDDCAAGAACASATNINQPLGSHANACVIDHCADGVKNSDEERADCGGADCAPCACQVSATVGATAYCPATCPCGVGDAACTQDAHCSSSLLCSANSGTKYGFDAGTGACTPIHCANAFWDEGETWPDCGGECGSCDVVEVTPTAGAISATTGQVQKILASNPVEITTVTNLQEGQTLCLFSETSLVTLDALQFNRIHDYPLVPGQPACFFVDAQLVLQSTNLEDETLSDPAELPNLDWRLSNETSQFQLNGSSITRWLASTGSARDVQQTTASLQPTLVDGGVLTAGTKYLLGVGSNADWTFLHQPGVIFAVFRPDTAASPSYLLGTVHDSSASAGSGFGIYFDTTVTPQRFRIRVGNGGAEYAYALTTTRSFPTGEKQLLTVSMTSSELEAYKSYDSVGVDATINGTLSSAAPYQVVHVGAKASTSKTPWPGSLYEFIHFSGELSPRARQAVARYLMNKHGIE